MPPALNKIWQLLSFEKFSARQRRPTAAEPLTMVTIQTDVTIVDCASGVMLTFVGLRLGPGC